MTPNLDTEDGRFEGYCLAQHLSFVANKTKNDAIAAMRGATDQVRVVLEEYLTTSQINRQTYNEVARLILEEANRQDDAWVRDGSVCQPAPDNLRANRLNGLSTTGLIQVPPLVIWLLVGGVVTAVTFGIAGYAITQATQGQYLAFEESKQLAIRAFQKCRQDNPGDTTGCKPIIEAIGKRPGSNIALIVTALAAAGIAFLYYRS